MHLIQVTLLKMTFHLNETCTDTHKFSIRAKYFLLILRVCLPSDMKYMTSVPSIGFLLLCLIEISAQCVNPILFNVASH